MATRQTPVTIGDCTYYGKSAKKARKLQASIVHWEKNQSKYGSHQRPGSLKGIRGGCK
jgi:hypothetical protein